MYKAKTLAGSSSIVVPVTPHRGVAAPMVLFILIVNRLVWQPAYDLAQQRLALNY